MNKFFAMENLLKSGFYNIPRVIVDNEQSSCKKTALRARILSYFYQKVYFAKSNVVLDGRLYTCFRGELIVNQEELAVRFETDRRQWTRIMAEFTSENIIRTEQVRGGTRITLVAYDCIVGKKSAQYKQGNVGDKAAEDAAPKAKKPKLGVMVENYYPEHHVKGCDIPPIEIDLEKLIALQKMREEENNKQKNIFR
ncbi:hypothetical protein ACOMSG_05140 [Macellibacteroides fermentans]|uniref:hypothetical protein n=1 Tax=Macellibacteroides fermentans TaxID=879969 RepID=UPI003B950726